MSEKGNTKNFEDLFRDGAPHQYFEYEPNDWLNLKKRLDQENDNPIIWRHLGIALAILTLGFTIFTFTKSSEKNLNPITSSIENIAQTTFKESQSATTISTNTNLNEENKVNVNESIAINKNDDNSNQNKSATSIIPKTSKNSIANNPRLIDAKSDSKGLVNEGQNATSQQYITTSQTTSQHTNSASAIPQKSQFPISVARSARNLNTSKHIASLAINNLNLKRLLHKEMNMAEILPLEMEKDKGLMLSFTLGRDWSSVGKSSKSNGDYKYGLGLSYFLNSKIGFSTGASYISDTYAAAGESYSPYYGYWANQSVPDRIDANCNMIEVPIGVIYYPKSFKENGFLFNTQFITVFMLQQQYNYWYAEDNPEFKKGWKSKGVDQDYFSQFKISAGYQHFISEKMSLQISPYMNLPISSLGFGNVKLSSYGVELRVGFSGF